MKVRKRHVLKLPATVNSAPRDAHVQMELPLQSAARQLSVFCWDVCKTISPVSDYVIVERDYKLDLSQLALVVFDDMNRA